MYAFLPVSCISTADVCHMYFKVVYIKTNQEKQHAKLGAWPALSFEHLNIDTMQHHWLFRVHMYTKLFKGIPVQQSSSYFGSIT